MNPAPRVTVLLPVYNAELHLHDAIISILQQTYRNFELLIINDASSDKSSIIIRSFSDERIRFIENKHNIGLSKTLNKGLKLARGEYIARMDNDDICKKNRLAKQVAFLDKHPNIAICGSAIACFSKRMSFTLKYPQTHEEIKAQLLFESPFAHPTIMLRRKIFEKHKLNYRKQWAEDYELWARSIPQLNSANLPGILLRYRLNISGTSAIMTAHHKKCAASVRQQLLKNCLGIQPTVAQLKLHERISQNSCQVSSKELNAIGAWFDILTEANMHRNYCTSQALRSHLAQRWYDCCRAATGLGISAYRQYIANKKYSARKLYRLSLMQQGRFFLAALYRTIKK